MWLALVEFVRKAHLGWAPVGIPAAPIYGLDLGEAANDPRWENPTDADGSDAPSSA